MRKPINLLLLVVAPLAAHAVESQSGIPFDETHVLIVNSGSTNFQGFSLILSEDVRPPARNTSLFPRAAVR